MSQTAPSKDIEVMAYGLYIDMRRKAGLSDRWAKKAENDREFWRHLVRRQLEAKL